MSAARLLKEGDGGPCAAAKRKHEGDGGPRAAAKRKHEGDGGPRAAAKRKHEGDGGLCAAQRKIWAPGVRAGKRDLGVVGGAPPAARSAEPAAEMARWRKVKRLRQKLHQLCAKAGRPVPLLAFERWQCASKLHESCAPCAPAGGDLAVAEPALEPLLPARHDWVEEGLVHDLVRGGIEKRLAEEIAQTMAETSARYAADLAQTDEREVSEGGEEMRVVTKVVGGVVDLFWGSPEAKPFMRISRAHLEKLRILFERHAESERQDASRRERAADADGSEMGQDFLRAALCVLLRYDALAGHGYQAALAEGAFDMLLAHMNCQQECFASPLVSEPRRVKPFLR